MTPTYRKLLEKELGRKGLRQLPESWKRRLHRKPTRRRKKPIKFEDILDVVGN